MSEDDVKTFLILKYGSIENAFCIWLYDKEQFSDAQKEVLGEHAIKILPNLVLDVKKEFNKLYDNPKDTDNEDE